MLHQTRRAELDRRLIGLAAVRHSTTEARTRNARAVIARIGAFPPSDRSAALDQGYTRASAPCSKET
jgi:hypothetical protein